MCSMTNYSNPRHESIMNQNPKSGWLKGPLTNEDVERLTHKLHGAGLIHSCLTCDNFDEKAELCELYKQRPPARVIAFGCPSWQNEIPF